MLLWQTVTWCRCMLCCECILQVFWHFVPRLRDQNTKVSLQAQQAFRQMLPVIASFSGLSNVIGLTVETVCINLRSRNAELRRSASSILDAVIHYIGNDGTCCLQLKLMKILYYNIFEQLPVGDVCPTVHVCLSVCLSWKGSETMQHCGSGTELCTKDRESYCQQLKIFRTWLTKY